MKIASIVGHPVRVPIPRVPYVTDGAGSKHHWWGRRSRLTPKRPEPVLEYVLVRVEADDGAVGWGEAQVDIGFFGSTIEDVLASVNDYLGPQLVGCDPFDRANLMARIDFRGHSCARAGIDMALHDLVSRRLETPLSTLLGGRCREQVEVSIEVAGGSATAMAAECVRLVELGVHEFKAKIGGHPDEDAYRLGAIREAVGPDVRLRADANQGYDSKEAIRFCRLVERADLRIGLLEQPVVAHDLAGMALVRASVDTPICADESCYGPSDAMSIVRAGAADVLNVKIGKAGGLLQAAKIAAIAEAAGLRCVLGTAFGTGLEIAAKLHLASALPMIVDAVEFTELSLHRSLLIGRWDGSFALPLSDGSLTVPTGPGLGVELDPEALRTHRPSAPVVA